LSVLLRHSYSKPHSACLWAFVARHALTAPLQGSFAAQNRPFVPACAGTPAQATQGVRFREAKKHSWSAVVRVATLHQVPGTQSTDAHRQARRESLTRSPAALRLLDVGPLCLRNRALRANVSGTLNVALNMNVLVTLRLPDQAC